MTTVTALLLILAFFVGEGRLRQGEAARTLEAGADDHGTTRRIGMSFGASLIAVAVSPLLDATGFGVLSEAVGWGGVVLMLVGLAVRVWAALTLGAWYTRTLRTSEAQRIVRSGPYRYVRHPGYAADILMWLGAGLAARSALALAFIAVVILSAYRARIAAEERMLVSAFGDDYGDWMRHSWRLVPFLY